MRSDVARFSSYTLDPRVKCKKRKKVTHPYVVLLRHSFCKLSNSARATGYESQKPPQTATRGKFGTPN